MENSDNSNAKCTRMLIILTFYFWKENMKILIGIWQKCWVFLFSSFSFWLCQTQGIERISQKMYGNTTQNLTSIFSTFILFCIFFLLFGFIPEIDAPIWMEKIRIFLFIHPQNSYGLSRFNIRLMYSFSSSLSSCWWYFTMDHTPPEKNNKIRYSNRVKWNGMIPFAKQKRNRIRWLQIANDTSPLQDLIGCVCVKVAKHHTYSNVCKQLVFQMPVFMYRRRYIYVRVKEESKKKANKLWSSLFV